VSCQLYVLRVASPASGAWDEVTKVDPLGDYARLFGERPPRITGIGINQDSENTASAAMVDIAALEWIVP
jgi:hypothetical protein